MHITFVLLVLFIFAAFWARDERLDSALAAVGFILALFGCVLLHELGHSLAARRFGIRTRDITLLPIGGMARLERNPDDPAQELVVAMAGPAVNLFIASVLYFWVQASGNFQPIVTLSITEGPILERLMLVNVMLVLFNMLPAFPMDGGRVLRAVLASQLDYSRATHLAAGMGQLMAVLFAVVGLFSSAFLLFIALFVYLGAAQERHMLSVRTTLEAVRIEQVMQTDYKTVYPGDTLKSVVELVLAGTQQDFPVVDYGRFLGILTRQDMLRGLTSGGEEARVEEYMRTDIPTVAPEETLQSVMPMLQESQISTAGVMKDGELVGLLTTDNLGEFFMIQSALGNSRLMRS